MPQKSERVIRNALVEEQRDNQVRQDDAQGKEQN